MKILLTIQLEGCNVVDIQMNGDKADSYLAAKFVSESCSE